ncbi:MAG: VCBS repeat-containing protein [Myxococcota bacterium]
MAFACGTTLVACAAAPSDGLMYGGDDETSAGVAVGTEATTGSTDAGAGTSTATPTSGGTGTSTADADADTTAAGSVFDVGGRQDLGTRPVCSVVAQRGAVPPCVEQAPPDAFEPVVQWSWTDPVYSMSIATPVVANLTDDNDDGVVDLCDVPDVVLTAMPAMGPGRIFVRSGDDGSPHFEIANFVNRRITPALGDITGDGVPEILHVASNILGTGPGNLVAFDAEQGAVLWTSEAGSGVVDYGGPALADLDADGDVEILLGGAVYDHEGLQLWNSGQDAGPAVGSVPIAADLDDDGDLEVIHGARAYHHDGSLYYESVLADETTHNGTPHIGNFDDDAEPEIVVLTSNGMSLLDHTGAALWTDQRPTGDPAEPWTVWLKPGTVHDFDGDGAAEFATGSGQHYAVYEIDAAGPSVVWQATVDDVTGSAAGTAFDFLGDGVAEAMYADESQLFVFDGDGVPLVTQTRESMTGFEYPVVADVDNDGSAEILVVSNFQASQAVPTPALQVIGDADDRWIAARRIWNQHAYHVTNVREDGTVPAVQPKSWQSLNTFRVNAQVEDGGVCRPAG